MNIYLLKLILILLFSICVNIYYINSECICCGNSCKTRGRRSSYRGKLGNINNRQKTAQKLTDEGEDDDEDEEDEEEEDEEQTNGEEKQHDNEEQGTNNGEEQEQVVNNEEQVVNNEEKESNNNKAEKGQGQEEERKKQLEKEEKEKKKKKKKKRKKGKKNLKKGKEEEKDDEEEKEDDGNNEEEKEEEKKEEKPRKKGKKKKRKKEENANNEDEENIEGEGGDDGGEGCGEEDDDNEKDFSSKLKKYFDVVIAKMKPKIYVGNKKEMNRRLFIANPSGEYNKINFLDEGKQMKDLFSYKKDIKTYDNLPLNNLSLISYCPKNENNKESEICEFKMNPDSTIENVFDYFKNASTWVNEKKTCLILFIKDQDRNIVSLTSNCGFFVIYKEKN